MDELFDSLHKQGKRVMKIAFLLGLLGGTVITLYAKKEIERLRPYAHDIPKQVSSVEDLNEDGLADLILQFEHERIPLYAIREGGNLIYFPKEEMKERFPDPSIDYDLIDNQVNEK